jgi:DNA/RNA endonuclease G (NUC1)
MTTIDPHDFNQPSLPPGFSDFHEPKVQVWENVTFADNYYQTVPSLERSSPLTPAGRDIPNLLGPDATGTAPGLKSPREGSRADWPTSDAPLLGAPDLAGFLGGRNNTSITDLSRAGFTQDDGLGGPHGRTLAWYAGTTNLNWSEFPQSQNGLSQNPIYRRLSDLHYQQLFDTNFRNAKPWYTPEYAGSAIGDANAPWEGIGTGWFYSVLGGGEDKRQYTNVERVPLDFDNTYDARLRGDYAVPTLFNGNFDAMANRFRQQDIPGWSFHNSAENASQQYLFDWKHIPSLADEYKTGVGYDYAHPNYALRLGAGLNEITHNRFVVPDWGVLRFDLHVPGTNSGTLDVTLTVDGRDYNLGQLSPNWPTIDLSTGNAINQIAYGEQGFETFQLDVPSELHGKVATLTFKSNSGAPIYLDDVFFKSEHLKFGNPTEARYTPEAPNTYRTNYLLEKPQYTVSYNDGTKGPNWVSWQLNSSWFGDAKRKNDFRRDTTLPSIWYKVRGEGDIGDKDNPASDGNSYSRGHMTPAEDRTRTAKDISATFLMTNMLPHNQNMNSSIWSTVERTSRNIVRSGRELYIIAGGDDSKATLTAGDSSTINVPDYAWKVILVLNSPGQSVSDVTRDTLAFAVYMPI